MKRFSVIAVPILLGFLLMAPPEPVNAAASKAESETAIKLSGWGDEAKKLSDTDDDELKGSTTVNAPKKDSGTSTSSFGKVFPKTGTILDNKFIVLGLVLVFGVWLFVIRRRREEEENNETQNS